MTKKSGADKQVRDALWKRGDLRWKLDVNQLEIYNTTLASLRKRWVWNCSRRMGKSYLLCVIACEVAIKNPGSRVNYAAPTATMAKELLADLMEAIIDDAPPECKPKFDTRTGHWQFPNKATIVMKGCEDKKKANRLRGPAAIMNIVDEAGFIPVLHYVLGSVLNPQLLTTGGRTIIASTPPMSLAHDFKTLADSAIASGTYITRTLYDNPRLTKDAVEAYIADDASMYNLLPEQFIQTTTFRREFLAEFCQDEHRSVIPEWLKYGHAAIKEVSAGRFSQLYVGMDFGMRDGDAAVFAHYDAQNGHVCVEGELHLRGQTTGTFASQIKSTEFEIWKSRSVHRRVGDAANPKDILNLTAEYGVAVTPTRKDDKRTQVNRVRQLLTQGFLFIHPRCKLLLNQMRDTVWKEDFTTYERDKHGHGDLLDALVYLCRNIDYTARQVPAEFYKSDTGEMVKLNSANQVRLDAAPNMSKSVTEIARAFGVDAAKKKKPLSYM